MPMRLNPTWLDEMRDKIVKASSKSSVDHEYLNVTLSANMAAKWLVVHLADSGVPFKVYNLGAGVKRITTDVDTCPCCKRKIV